MTTRCVLIRGANGTAEIQCGSSTYLLEEVTGGVSKGANPVPEITKDDQIGVARVAGQVQRTEPRWVVVRINSLAVQHAITEPCWEELDDAQLVAAFSAWLAKQSSPG